MAPLPIAPWPGGHPPAGDAELQEATVLLLSGYTSDAKGELWRGWMHTYSDKEE